MKVLALRGARAGAWLALLAAAALAGCLSPAPYVCGSATDCTHDGVAGACVAADDGRRYCAEPDGACASGQRFGDSAGALAGTCAGATLLSGDECFPGPPLAAAQSSCIATVCADQPWCCAASWGPGCVQRAEVACNAACSGRVAFTRERLTNADHSQILEDGALEVWDFAAGEPLGATAAPTGIAGPEGYRAGAWIDLERDGVAELLVTTFDGYVGPGQQRIWRPAATAWQLVVDLVAIAGPTNGLGAAFGDHDRDGRVDLAMVGYGIDLFHGVATGDFFAPGVGVPTLPGTDPLTSAIDAGDLDGDGDDDLVYLDYRNNLGQVLRSEGDHFELGTGFTTISGTRSIRVGDVDGDQDLDLLMLDSGGAMILRNDAAAFTPIWSYPPGPRTSANYMAAIWIDVEGDGDLDVAFAEGDLNDLMVFENVGGALGTTPLWQAAGGLRSGIETMAAGDVDGDGDLDLVVAGGDEAPSRIWLNDGDRTFSVGWTDASIRRHRGAAPTRRP